MINNPLLIVDPDGMDTLVVHTQMLSPKTHPQLKHSDGSETVAFQLTFSLIKNGREIPLNPELSERETTFYLALPKGHWHSGNIWYTDGPEEWLSVRFEFYKGSYQNSIRIKYPKGEGFSTRVLAHTLTSTAGSRGCNMPTCELIEGEAYNGLTTFPVIKSKKGQEVLDKIREMHDQYLNPQSTTNKWGREVQEPGAGNDFMFKTNSTAPTRSSIGPINPIPLNMVQPIDLMKQEDDRNE